MDSLFSQLQAVKFLTLRLHMRVEEPLELPVYKGSTLRGAFGAVFKDTVCVVPHQDCPRCMLQSHCAYPYIFETPVPKDSKRMRKYPSAPHPFILLPPLSSQRHYNSGETICFNLTLIGRGIDYIPHFIFTFARFSEYRGLGKHRGKCTLTSVQWKSSEGEWVAIYRDTDQRLRDCYRPESISAPDSAILAKNQLTLSFLTPTRLVYAGSLVADLQFHTLCRTLLRRLSNLMYFHCGAELDVDFKGLIQNSTEVIAVSNKQQWYDWKRFSSRQQRHIQQGGLVGEITYQGNFHPFLSLLQLGQITHVGKSTVLGMGKFLIL